MNPIEVAQRIREIEQTVNLQNEEYRKQLHHQYQEHFKQYQQSCRKHYSSKGVPPPEKLSPKTVASLIGIGFAFGYLMHWVIR